MGRKIARTVTDMDVMKTIVGRSNKKMRFAPIVTDAATAKMTAELNKETIRVIKLRLIT